MGTIRVEVDASLCQGYANCLTAAPGLFELGEDDIARPLPAEQAESARALLEAAARRCPTGAILLTDV